MIKTILASATVVAALSVGFVATAQDKGPYDSAIKGRQAMFQTYNFNVGILSAMAKEKMPYDAELASQSAANLDAAANFSQSAMWPEGSDNESPGNAKNRALPAIWSSFPAIMEKSDALKAASKTLAMEAGNGLAALQGAMGDVGASCKGCHDDFRAKRR
jgi:cytochrome c556